jgi:hypothetical protein
VAQQPEGAQGAAGIGGFQAHDWYSYEAYQNVHYSKLETLMQDGVVRRHSLSIYEVQDDRSELLKVNIRGRILCDQNVVIRIDKWLAVRRHPRGHLEVKGTDYAYHAWLRGAGRNLIRYCTAHGLGDLHYHAFDLVTGDETEQVRIDLRALPLLADFIQQAVELGRRTRPQT